MTKLPTRVAVALVVLLLGALAVAEHLRLERRLARLESLARELGVAEEHPEALSDLRRAQGRARSALRLARLLLAVELDRGLRPDADEPIDSSLGLARLEAARELAARALDEQPSSWQGWMVLGGARFLELSRRRDPRLASERAYWQEPLERARRLAPAQPEPTRLLAAAHLSEWSRLDDAEREAAVEVIAEALVHPTSFDLLIELWLRVAPSRRAAFALVPQLPERWRSVMTWYQREEDWERWCQARESWLDALEATARERLAAPETDPKVRAEGRTARRILGVVAAMPPSTRLAPWIAEALGRLPAGEAIPPNPGSFGPWLDWALELCALDACPVPPELLRRLAEAAGQLAPVDRVRLALALGDPAEAARLAERHRAEDPEGWRSYRELTRAASELAQPGTRWPPPGWRRRVGVHRLGPIATAAGSGLEVTIDQAPGAPGAVVARWDGAEAGCHPVVSGGRLTLALPIPAGTHLLELIADARLGPAEVRLRTESREAPR
ncbi:MAG: hypothetical protein R3325_12485 [Thermoanaerobaculia bacterium]|nr:hypothetical protein [Thermoanaerobaculia bacterium]